jgi:hypothetical protein
MVERHDDSEQGHDQKASAHTSPDEDLAYWGQADHDQHALTFDAMHRFGIPVSELWMYYLGIGGDADELEIDAYLHGLIRLPALARDMIAQSVNEMIDDICRETRAPYSSKRNKNTSDTGPDTHLDAEVRAALRVGGASRDNRNMPEGDEACAGTEPTDGAARKDRMLSVVYSSVATQSFSDADLAKLLAASRRTNNSSHLTGLLLYRQGRFLQVLEGPEATVRDRMAIIRADPRHTRVRVLVEETRHERQFPDWTMGYEPISATMSDEVPGYEKTFTDAEHDPDPAGTIQVLLKLIRWFQDRAIPLR